VAANSWYTVDTMNKVAKLLYYDNIRIFLTALVIFVHLNDTYTHVAKWYVTVGTADTASMVVGGFVASMIQAFVLALFFYISALFIQQSLERKGRLRFVTDRLVKLGIPLVVFTFIIDPATRFFLDPALSWKDLWSFYSTEILSFRSLNPGPLWFVAALLLFSIAYAVWDKWIKAKINSVKKFPPLWGLLAVVAGLAIFSFAVRIFWPVGKMFFCFQFAHFPQYIVWFAFGVIASRTDIINRITKDQARFWLWGSLATVVVWLPLFVAGGALSAGIQPFLGGFNWQSLVYCVWEQFACMALNISILYVFANLLNKQTRFFKEISISAFSTYILHAVVIIVLTLVTANLPLHNLLMFAISLAYIPVCFSIGWIVKKTPIIGRFV
jgi:hypothetical protein